MDDFVIRTAQRPEGLYMNAADLVHVLRVTATDPRLRAEQAHHLRLISDLIEVIAREEI